MFEMVLRCASTGMERDMRYIYIYTSSLNFFLSRSGNSVTNGNHYIPFENHAICYHISIEVDTFHHVSIAITVGQMPNAKWGASRTVFVILSISLIDNFNSSNVIIYRPFQIQFKTNKIDDSCGLDEQFNSPPKIKRTLTNTRHAPLLCCFYSIRDVRANNLNYNSSINFHMQKHQ